MKFRQPTFQVPKLKKQKLQNITDPHHLDSEIPQDIITSSDLEVTEATPEFVEGSFELGLVRGSFYCTSIFC